MSNNPLDEEEKKREQRRETINLLKSVSPLEKKIYNAVTRAGIYVYAFLVLCSGKEGAFRLWKALSSKRHRIGLLEGAVLGPSLWVPTENGFVEKMTAPAGRWCGYDPSRLVKLRTNEEKGTGRLEAILDEYTLDETRDQNDLTPTGTYDLLDLYTLLSIDSVGIEKAERIGLVQETTYGRAFAKLGLSGYLNSIETVGAAQDKIWQVTPKGNGIVYLIPDGGEKKELPDGSPERGTLLPQF
ncbi:hypothetical protein HY495_02005 [Candidatus Woesearchaeota archaeon]|nr:hypothetical protein [Candidatus Woesearchaeota archaeon]